jgi:Tfp pilus assembly protein PilX
MSKPLTPLRRQRGAVLVVGLIMLAVMFVKYQFDLKVLGL